jgi:hypothetical protein
MWATARIMGLAEMLEKHGLSVQSIREKLLEEAELLCLDDIALNKRIGLYGSEVVPEGANILHHCNTGTIATVQYGTAIGVRLYDSFAPCALSIKDDVCRFSCIVSRLSILATRKAKTCTCGLTRRGRGCRAPSSPRGN